MSYKINYVVNMTSIDRIIGDSTIAAMCADANNKGATRYPRGLQTVYEVYESFSNLEEAKGIVTGGHGDVEKYRLYIEIDDADDIVPAGLIGGGVPWSDWCKPNCPPIEIDGRTFVNTSAHTGVLPNLADLTPVFDSLVDLVNMPTAPQES